MLSFTDTGYNTSDSIKVIEVVNDGTRYYRTRTIASLNIDQVQTHVFDNWQLSGKQLIVRARNITTSDSSPSQRHAVVELNFDNAQPNDSMINLILCGYQGWFAYPGDGSLNRWRHWFNAPQDPTVDNLTVEMYPYNDEYNDEDLMEANVLMRDGGKARF